MVEFVIKSGTWAVVVFYDPLATKTKSRDFHDADNQNGKNSDKYEGESTYSIQL